MQCANTTSFYVSVSNGGKATKPVSVFVPSSTCNYVLLSQSEFDTFNGLSLTMGWDSDAFSLAVFGALLMFVTGVGVGLISNTIRRARSF